MPSEQRGSVSVCKDVNINVSEMGKGTGRWRAVTPHSQWITREPCKLECQEHQVGK